jgi:hypothetical protein
LMLASRLVLVAGLCDFPWKKSALHVPLNPELGVAFATI